MSTITRILFFCAAHYLQTIGRVARFYRAPGTTVIQKPASGNLKERQEILQ
jgi:hypothetical protein